MRIAALLSVFFLVACGGGGGGGGENGEPVYDLNGWWEYTSRETGSDQPYERSLIGPVTHTGSTVVVNSFVHTLSGSTLSAAQPDTTSPDRTMSMLNVVSNDFLEGSTVTYQGNVKVSQKDIRHFRTTTPTGTFTIAGTVGSTPVAVNSTTSYASSSENRTLSTYTVLFVDKHPSSQNLLLLQWPKLSPLAAATYPLGSGLAAAAVRPDGMTAAPASAGSVEITSWTASHIAGSYSINITGGGTVDGVFAVDILIQN